MLKKASSTRTVLPAVWEASPQPAMVSWGCKPCLLGAANAPGLLLRSHHNWDSGKIEAAPLTCLFPAPSPHSSCASPPWCCTSRGRGLVCFFFLSLSQNQWWWQSYKVNDGKGEESTPCQIWCRRQLEEPITSSVALGYVGGYIGECNVSETGEQSLSPWTLIINVEGIHCQLLVWRGGRIAHEMS